MLGAIEALKASTLRLPVVGGAIVCSLGYFAQFLKLNKISTFLDQKRVKGIELGKI